MTVIYQPNSPTIICSKCDCHYGYVFRNAPDKHCGTFSNVIYNELKRIIVLYPIERHYNSAVTLFLVLDSLIKLSYKSAMDISWHY